MDYPIDDKSIHQKFNKKTTAEKVYDYFHKFWKD